MYNYVQLCVKYRLQKPCIRVISSSAKARFRVSSGLWCIFAMLK